MSERCRERMNVLRHCLLVVAALRLRGGSKATQIRRDHAMRLGKLGNERSPHVARLGIAMQQKNWITLPCNEVLKPDLGKFRRPSFDRDRVLCNHSSTSSVWCIRETCRTLKITAPPRPAFDAYPLARRSDRALCHRAGPRGHRSQRRDGG